MQNRKLKWTGIWIITLQICIISNICGQGRSLSSWIRLNSGFTLWVSFANKNSTWMKILRNDVQTGLQYYCINYHRKKFCTNHIIFKFLNDSKVCTICMSIYLFLLFYYDSKSERKDSAFISFYFSVQYVEIFYSFIKLLARE